MVATAWNRCWWRTDILRRWSCRKKLAPPAVKEARMEDKRTDGGLRRKSNRDSVVNPSRIRHKGQFCFEDFDEISKRSKASSMMHRNGDEISRFQIDVRRRHKKDIDGTWRRLTTISVELEAEEELESRRRSLQRLTVECVGEEGDWVDSEEENELTQSGFFLLCLRYELSWLSSLNEVLKNDWVDSVIICFFFFLFKFVIYFF